MANFHLRAWFGLRKWGASWNHEPITTVNGITGRTWEELGIVANSSGATVIFLHSHPVWLAAQRHARERGEAMRRHPSARFRQRSATSATRDFTICTSNNTPA
ncbi:hypothetical protein BN971_00599 [Mycobacterium bohemicum DSM 44277]|uniref:Uncharacterized protein n=1 Tax=Mycobacterium bohemicum DSM 44277 TaxID=1236609 RepID=A0A0U0W4T5_MYCBE|nr:hypothetical protein [Mycobacterium bohemicum]CPR05530.1 hypothetical protein BN971_00599 [Mycobacterium bohemicum DSM 44277]